MSLGFRNSYSLTAPQEFKTGPKPQSAVADLKLYMSVHPFIEPRGPAFLNGPSECPQSFLAPAKGMQVVTRL